MFLAFSPVVLALQAQWLVHELVALRLKMCVFFVFHMIPAINGDYFPQQH